METNAESKHTDDGYFMASKDEISRLENNHYIIKAAMGGNLLLPPINITTSPLRILDSATADGKSFLAIKLFHISPLDFYSM